MIIVIDGPAGSGKSSTAQTVADRLHIQYLDSGALYRTLTLLFLEYSEEQTTEVENLAGKLEDLLRKHEVSFEYYDQQFHTYINGTEVTGQIRNSIINNHVSDIASLPDARVVVNELMREGVKNRYFIADGRDLGTVVFPDADLKFYMVADVETRARRRWEELKGMDQETPYEEVLENIKNRDRQDMERAVAPLKQPEDAITIDTTSKTFDEQIELISSYITGHFKELEQT